MATKTKAALKLRPLGDRVLVTPDEEASDKVGSLYVPDTAKEKPQRGEVVAVGAGRKNEKGEVLDDMAVEFRGVEDRRDGGDVLVHQDRAQHPAGPFRGHEGVRVQKQHVK